MVNGGEREGPPQAGWATDIHCTFLLPLLSVWVLRGRAGASNEKLRHRVQVGVCELVACGLFHTHGRPVAGRSLNQNGFCHYP